MKITCCKELLKFELNEEWDSINYGIWVIF